MRKARSWLPLTRSLAVIVIVTMATRWAWLGDDSLITLRQALNLARGWGWGYNLDEAVQGYTHPLWFLAIVGVGSLTNQWILGVIALSLVLTAVTAVIVVCTMRSVTGVVLATALLVLSNAFIEYCTSGLETPLAFAIVAALVALTLRMTADRSASTGRLVLLGLLAGALVLTRHDLAVLAAIPVVWATWHATRWRGIAVTGISAAAPVVLWSVVAFTTYGSILPNTFYAKTRLEIPRIELVLQGGRYLYVTASHDPVTLIALLVGLATMLFFGLGLARAWAVGVLLYIAYWTWVGGDFMAGRAVAVSVLVCAMAVGLAGDRRWARLPQISVPLAILIPTGLLGLLLVATPYSTALQATFPQEERWSTELNGGVADELGVYAKSGRMLQSFINEIGNGDWTRDRGPAAFPVDEAEADARVEKIATWQTDLIQLNRVTQAWPEASAQAGSLIDVRGPGAPLGASGLVLGPRFHLVDQDGLVDAFLARQPYQADGFHWRIGHFSRPLPDGYLDAIRTGNPMVLTDARLALELRQLWGSIR